MGEDVDFNESDDTLEQAVLELGQLLEASGPIFRRSVSELVQGGLEFRRLDITPREGVHARSQLQARLTSLSPERRAGHLRRAAELVWRARAIQQFHSACPLSAEHFQSTLTMLESALYLEPGVMPAAVTAGETLVLWSLARWAHDAVAGQQHMALAEATGEKRLAQIRKSTASRRLGGRRQVTREADLKKLTARAPGLYEAFDELRSAGGIPPAAIQELMILDEELRRTQSETCYCRDTGRLWRVVLNHPVKPTWVTLPAGPLEELLQTVVVLGAPRRDVILVGHDALVVDAQGFSDAFLLALLQQAEQQLQGQAAAWQESTLSSSVRQLFRSGGRVQSQFRWVRDVSAPGTHEGEVDVLARLGPFVFDFQAKAPYAAKFGDRSSRIETEALKQHMSFRAALHEGLYEVRRKPEGIWKVASTAPVRLESGNVQVHVPISVGVDPVREWSVGPGSEQESGRVMTTVDHVRLVNDFVPDIFRPVYWLDRYLQQFGDLKFVDETDFFGRWFERLCGTHVPDLIVMSELNLVEAWLSPLEEFVVAENALLAALTRDLKLSTPVLGDVEARLRSRLPTAVAPNFMKALRQAAEHGTGWLYIAMHSVGLNLVGVEKSVAGRNSVRLRTPTCVWGILGRPVGVPLEEVGLDAALVKTQDGWRTWTSPVWVDTFCEKLRAGQIPQRHFGNGPRIVEGAKSLT